ncbi:MAG: ATP-binding protein [Thermoprotei archaeon]|jgi:DNA helicase HerA-like ATPase
MENIGYIVGGSLEKGVQIKLNVSSEDIAVGNLKVANGIRRKYLLLLNNIYHGNMDVANKLSSSSVSSGLMDIMREEILPSYANGIVIAQGDNDKVEEANTIPDYLSSVTTLTMNDVKIFYGTPDENNFLKLSFGSPIGIENALIPVDIPMLTKSSFAIYGKTGTGKTVLGNIIAINIALYTAQRKYSNDNEYTPVSMLILDMHSEYGTTVKDMYGKQLGDGVARIMPNEFIVYTPDEELAKISKEDGYPMYMLKISASEIEPQDIILMSELLNLTDIQTSTLQTISEQIQRIAKEIKEHEYKDYPWITYLYDDNLYEKLISELTGEEEKKKRPDSKTILTIQSLHKKLSFLKNYKFIEEKGESKGIIDSIVESLLGKELKHIVISFGAYGDDVRAYTLVTNMIARRLLENAVELGLQKRELTKRIVIFVEEAHKFLDPKLKENSPMGKIARELRKRGITLCIIDQRPSQIDPDVSSMIWNTFTSVLGDENDIKAATINLTNSKLYDPIIRSLTRQNFLAYGDAFRFPIVVKTIDYSAYAKHAMELYSKIRASIKSIDETLRNEI